MISQNSILELERFFKDKPILKGKVELSPCETIIDMEKFIDSHLTLLKLHYDKKIAVPYFDRLIKLKNLFNHE